MNIKKHIPNLFTLGNLLCGTLATFYAVVGRFEWVVYLVLLGIVLDFFDGFLARILGVQGELGKQLDSLADMVTSGVVPGIVMFSTFKMVMMEAYENMDLFSYYLMSDVVGKSEFSPENSFLLYLPYLGFLLTLAACYRLGKFNIDTRQTDSFIGMPTPAMTLFVVCLPLIFMSMPKDISAFDQIDASNIDWYGNILILYAKLFYPLRNIYFLILVTLGLSYLMNSNLRLLALKFKSFGFKENLMRYILIGISILLLAAFRLGGIPLIIFIYILLSVLDNDLTKKKQKEAID